MNPSNLSVKFFLTSILFFTLFISISLNSTVHAQSDSSNVIEGILYDLHGSLPDGSHITEYYIEEKNEDQSLKYSGINFTAMPSNISKLLGNKVVAQVSPISAQVNSSGESSYVFLIDSIELVDDALVSQSIPQATSLSGTKSIPTLMVKYADKSVTTHAQSYVQEKFYDASDGLHQLYQTVSYGNFGLTGTASEWRSLSGTYASYTVGKNYVESLMLVAEHAMQAHPEINYNSIDGLIIVANGCFESFCSAWGTTAPFQINSPSGLIYVTISWLPDTTSDQNFGSWSIGEADSNGIRVAAHEVGHNLGFDHTTLPPGNWTGGAEYGVYTDMWSIMSSSWDYEAPSPFPVGQRSDVGWIPASNKAVVSRGASDTITIDYANEPLNGSNKKMITIPLPDGTSYILGAHKDGGFSDTPNDNEGIVMYKFYPNGNQFSQIVSSGTDIQYVLVGTAGTEIKSNFANANLDVGETFTDSVNNVTVSTISKTVTSVTVAISNNGPTDSDGDGFNDNVDSCPTVAGVSPDGCPLPIDTDGDGITDDVDSCPTVAGVAPDGCPADTDGDGIPDDVDSCPTIAGVAPDGCPADDGTVDADSDGVTNDVDFCPSAFALTANGCPPETDSDRDRVPNDVDACPFAFAPTSDGCPTSDDSDGDSILNDVDACPTIFAYTFDGCPVMADSDGDGLYDGVDFCPDTFALTFDGCPTSDDSDGDGVSDFYDRCPFAFALTYEGCPTTMADSDGDGLHDGFDFCPYTFALTFDGCPEFDFDGDGFTDDVDACPWVYALTADGCAPLNDSDSDGVLNDADACPYILAYTSTGCPEFDYDGDGLLDVDDPCPADPSNLCIDTILSIPVITSPADGDTITTDNVVITGTAEADVTIEVFDDITLLGIASVDTAAAGFESGDTTAWIFTTETLPDGEHIFTATASDDVTTSDPSAAVTVTIDTGTPPSYTAWTQKVLDLRLAKSQAFQDTFPIDTDAQINRLLAWAGNLTVQTNNPVLEQYAHLYSIMKRWNERTDLQIGFPGVNLAADPVALVIWSGRVNVLENPFNTDLAAHEPIYVLLRYFFLERDDLRTNPAFAGALDGSDPSRLFCFAANSGDSRLTPHKAFYENNCVAASQETTKAFSFGGTLESAQPTFDIMDSDGATSTYGKQGYSYGFKAVGTGLTVINSDQICGLSLCSEKMDTAEKIQQYLDQLFEEKSATTQRSFGGTIGFDSSVSVIPSSDTTSYTISGTVFDDINGNGIQESSESGLGNILVAISEFQNWIEDMFTTFTGNYSSSPLPSSTYQITADMGGTGYTPTMGFSSSVTIDLSSDTSTNVNFPMQIDTVPPQIFNKVHWDSCLNKFTIVFEPDHGIDPNGNHDLSLVEVRDLNSNRHFSLERSNVLEISSDHITLELKKKHYNQLENRMTSPTLTTFDGAFVDESGNRSQLTTDVPIFDVCF